MSVNILEKSERQKKFLHTHHQLPTVLPHVLIRKIRRVHQGRQQRPNQALQVLESRKRPRMPRREMHHLHNCQWKWLSAGRRAERWWSGKPHHQAIPLKSSCFSPTLRHGLPLRLLILFSFSPISAGRVWGFCGHRMRGQGRPWVVFKKAKFKQENNNVCSLFRPQFMAWRWGPCWGPALFCPEFPCLLFLSLRVRCIFIYWSQTNEE